MKRLTLAMLLVEAACYPGLPISALDGPADAGTDPFAAPPTCTSDTYYASGEDDRMHPGRACVSCHASELEGPLYTVAGTLYPTAHEPADCNGTNGVIGAKVVLTDANGVTITLTPNSVGNFFREAVVAFPAQVKVVFQGRERPMSAAISDGDCNRCHTQSGINNAPGRILLP